MKRVCWGLGSTLLLSGAALLSPGGVGASGVSQAREVAPPPGDRGELLYELSGLPGAPAVPDKRAGGAPASAVAPGRRASPPLPTPATVPQAAASRSGVSAPTGAAHKSLTLPAAGSAARPTRDQGVSDAQAATARRSVEPTPARRARQADATVPAPRRGNRAAVEVAGAPRAGKAPAKPVNKTRDTSPLKTAEKANTQANIQAGATRPRPSSAVGREGRGREQALAPRAVPPVQAKQKAPAGSRAPTSLRQADRAMSRSPDRSARLSTAPSRKATTEAQPKVRSRTSPSEGRDVGRGRDVARAAEAPRERRVPRETPPRSGPKAAVKSGAKVVVKQAAPQAATSRTAKPGVKPNPKKVARPPSR